MDLLGKLAEYGPWLNILGRKSPDNRLRDEELILRFFAFQILGVGRYRTPQKYWLNDMAEAGRRYDDERIGQLERLWKDTVDKCLVIFEPQECFRRIPLQKKTVVNRALMDLTMHSLANTSKEVVERISAEYHRRYQGLLEDTCFLGLITRGVDHKTRTGQRFDMWHRKITSEVLSETDA